MPDLGAFAACIQDLRKLLSQEDFWHGQRRLSAHFHPGELAGYPMDLSAKTSAYDGPTGDLGIPLVDFGPSVGLRLHPVTVCQVALGWHERWLCERTEETRGRFLALADWLIAHQRPWAGGGAWPIDVTFRSYGRLSAPWVSALVQGQALSVLARACQLSFEPEPGWRSRARAAMESAFVLFELDVDKGGVRSRDHYGVGYEEYPSRHPSLVLNGLISALWGLYDLALVQGDGPARRAHDAAVVALLDRLARYDLGFWSRYCLYPYPFPEIASPYYHREHLAQLEAMDRLWPDPRWSRMRLRWQRYQASPIARTLALGGKALSRAGRAWASRGREYEAGAEMSLPSSA
jgi:hypothetical protein